MANELRTNFVIGNERDFFRQVDLYENKLNTLNSKLNSLGGTVNFGGNVQTQVNRLTQPVDNLLKKTQEDIKKLQAETLAGEKAVTRSVEREAKLQADAKIREQRRAADNFLRTLSETSRAERAASARRQIGSDLLGGLGVPLGVGAGVAFGATALERSIQRSFEAERANRLLAASATEAGLSYKFLAQNNEKFAKDAGLAQNAAASLTARITQLATAAGRPQDVEKLQRSFLNLGSARGIGTADLETLIGTILSGQDEGLNRLGLADPSKLQEKYAASLGKTADALSQTEKTQAAVNAVMEKAAIFTGANEERMRSLSGQAETARSQLDNLTASFGNTVTNTLEFRDALKLANDILGSMTTNISSVRKQLAEGLTPTEIAQKEADSLFNQVFDLGKDTSLVTAKGGIYIYDLITEGFETANDRFIEAVSGARKRRIDELTKLIQGEQKLIDNQNKAALEQADKLKLKQFEESEKSRQETLKKTRQENLQKLQKDLSDSDLPLPELRDRQRKILSVETNIEIEEKLRLADEIGRRIADSVEKGREKVKDLEKQYLSVLDNLSAKRANDNPFVALFTEADSAMRNLREQTRGLGQDIRNSFEQLLRSQNQISLFTAKLENRLGAGDLRSDAANFRNPFDGDRVKREEDEFIRRFLRNNPNYLYLQGKSELDETGRRDILSRGSFDSQQKRLNDRIDEDYRTIYGGRKLSPEDQAIADRQFISRTAGVDPLDLSSSNREQAALAREREAARRERYEQTALDLYKEQRDFQQQIAANTAAQNKIAEEQGERGIRVLLENNAPGTKATVARPGRADVEQTFSFGGFPITSGSNK